MAPAQEVEQRLSQLEATHASLAEVAAQISASLDQLSFLTGQHSEALDARLAAPQGDAPAALPALPSSVAVGDPATLLTALRDANTALSRFGHQREELLSLMAQESSATRRWTWLASVARLGWAASSS